MGRLDPKSTGGEGFDFEDKVGAYFLSFLLAGKEPFPTLNMGRLAAVKFQRKVEEWEIDDLVLEFEASGFKRSCAFSSKSNNQITAKKVPADFVTSIWKQFTKKENNPFKSKHDYLGIITSGASTSAIESFRQLQKFTTRHKGRDLHIFLQKPEFTNQDVRDMYASFTRPANIEAEQEIYHGDVISRTLHYDLNFDDPTSTNLKEAFGNLAMASPSGEPNELWIRLQHITKTSRSVSGEVKFNNLVNELKEAFELKGHYDLESDLQKLKSLYDTEVERIKSTVGNNLFVERSLSFSKDFRKDQINALIGESGIGKSTLLKQWLDQQTATIIWLPYSLFKVRALSEIGSILKLKNDLFDIFKYGPGEQILVLDGIDRLTSVEEREILRAFLSAFHKISAGRHLCIVCSQDQIWKVLIGQLSMTNVMFNVVTAPPFGKSELDFISQEIPTLTGILKLPLTRDILRNPKYIDLAVQISDSSPFDPAKALSEPALIKGFWDLISKSKSGYQKQALLMRIAVDQADSGNFLTQLLELSSDDTNLLDELALEGIITVQDGLIRFSHDLYGDWLRQRYLLSQQPSYLPEVLKRKNNIYWHQAIRLLSLEVLEVQGFVKWKGTVSSLKASNEMVLIDLFMDIAITSLNQRIILDSIKDLLFEDNFIFLSRFLERFLIYATAPNAVIMSMREQFGLSEVDAANINRVPLYSYWPSLIKFLSENVGSIDGSKIQMAQVAEKWLISTPLTFPYRQEAASIILNAANWVFSLKHGSHAIIVDNVDKGIYQALLSAHSERPHEVEDLCQKLIGLKPLGLTMPVKVIKKNRNLPEPIIPVTSRRRIEKKAWPLGPQFKKDQAFQSVCFSSQSFQKLVEGDPKFASQVLLAAIIDDPREWESYNDSEWATQDQLATSFTQDFYPPFYTKGPFLNFFRSAPQEALETLISLINFVTDRWAQREKKRTNDFSSIEIEFKGVKKLWTGDAQVFCWAMDLGQCPDIVVSYLMSLEQWLYEKIAASDNIVPWIEQVLEKSSSLALLGVLTSIAKKSPTLFEGPLNGLLYSPYLIWWDQQYVNQNGAGGSWAISWANRDQFSANLAQKWFTLEHRGISIEQWALHFLLNVPEMQGSFSKARSEWNKEFEGKSDHALEALYHRFDPSNYKTMMLPDGTEAWKYTPPASFIEKYSQRHQKNEAQMKLLTFSYRVNKLLDTSPISVEQFEALVNDADEINKIITESNDPMLTSPSDCKLAVDGLKLIAFKEKIGTFQLKEIELAKEDISNAIFGLWNEPGIAGYSSDRSDFKYDAILAKIFGRLALKNEHDPWLREQIAVLICGPREASLAILVKSLNAHKVSSNFLLECIHLIVEYSKARTAWSDVERAIPFHQESRKKNFIKNLLSKSKFTRNIIKEYDLKDREDLFNHHIQNLIDSFVWSKVSEPRWPTWEYDSSTYAFSYGLDLFTIDKGVIDLHSFTHAVANLAPINSWDDDLFRGWIDFCEQGMIKIIDRLVESIREHGKAGRGPFTQDTWLIGMFATTYFWKSDTKLDQTLKRYLEVGEKGRSWLDDFGTVFFRLGVWEPSQIENFKIKLSKIFDIAISIDTLKKKSWDVDDIWCSLVGLDDVAMQFYPEESHNIFNELTPLYERWIKERTGSYKGLQRFAYLLSQPAGKGIRVKTLSLLAFELRDVDFSDYYYEHSISTYSYLLTTIWQENQIELRENRDAIAAFLQILNSLIKAQDPRSLELANQVNSTKF